MGTWVLKFFCFSKSDASDEVEVLVSEISDLMLSIDMNEFTEYCLSSIEIQLLLVSITAVLVSEAQVHERFCCLSNTVL